jgi:hypothetical protein
MADGRLRQLFWRVVDHLDYLMTLVRLRILDALAGPLPRRRPIGSAIAIRNGYGGRSPRSSCRELGAPSSHPPIASPSKLSVNCDMAPQVLQFSTQSN